MAFDSRIAGFKLTSTMVVGSAGMAMAGQDPPYEFGEY